MDIESIKIKSRETRQTAEKILEDAKVLETLSEHGIATVGGSYALDLMYGPDIDVTVECTHPREASVSCLNSFIENGRFQKYEYGDFVKHPRKNRPKGFIVNLRNTIDDRMWEIEIWFLESVSKNDREYISNISKQLTPSIRERILLIKHQREQSEFTKHNLSSVAIYNAVLENNAKDIKDIV